MSLYKDIIVESQELRSKFDKMVLKFLSIISISKAFTYKNLFYIVLKFILI